MRCISSVILLAGALVLVASSATGREREEVGTSSDPLKVAPSPSTKSKPKDTCKQGYVWREARASDHVCVTPQTRNDVASQNRSAKGLWVQGAYGPHTCVQGYVWREAFNGDDVCVRPGARDQAHEDNRRAAQRRVGG